MLYGNLIFIKKTGGDGSKFPVTEKNIKIGRSENCLIRIYNPQVAPEHCQLIIDCNGQAKLRNLFTPTILNGKPLGQGDVTLCHGDVFKLGERLARWEYLPTSKYFRQLLSPTGRLVAVVNPQRRSMQETPGTLETQVSVSKSTPLGSKRKLYEKVTEGSSMAKQRKTVGLDDSSLKTKIDLGRLLIGRHSIKSGKLLLKAPTVKQRKSVSGIISSGTSKKKLGKSRKSTLPSWKVNEYAQQKESIQNKRSPPKHAVKTPPKKSLKSEVRTPSKSTPIKAKTPKRFKLDPKTGDKLPLKTILESPQPESVRTTRSFSKSPPMKVSSPQRKSLVQTVRLVQSEKKPKTCFGTPKSNMNFGKMSLVLKSVDRDRRIKLSPKNGISGRKSANGKVLKSEIETEVEISSEIANSASSPKSSVKDKFLQECNASFTSPKQSRKKSVKSTPVKSPQKSSKPLNRSSVQKTKEKIAVTPSLIDFSDENDSDNAKQTSRESVISSRKSLKKSVRKSSAHSLKVFQTPQKILRKVSTPVIEKIGEPSGSDVVSTTPRSRKFENVTASKKVFSSSKKKGVSPRGVRRKLSPSISSAERAAKKLKTSCPRKPDKNKRAALLVLGKASRKQLLSQNVKVLKQKIVKKAIKQSVPKPVLENEKKKTSLKSIKKILDKKKKKSAKINKTVSVSVPERISKTVKKFPLSNELIEKSISESEKSAGNVKKSPERNSNAQSKLSPVIPEQLATPSTSSVKAPWKGIKSAESILSPKSTNQAISPYVKFDKSSESYLFSSNRRCSKRLSSKNDTERPDFVELSPTALGLIPKNIEIFKTPKEKKRKSSSLVTPRNIRASGIMKSASTSKIGNLKSVSFSSQDLSLNSTTYTPNINEKTDFDFDSFHTSNITMDVFVSPLNKSNATPVVDFGTDENLKPSTKRTSTPASKKFVRKLLQTPQKEPGSNLPAHKDQVQTPMKTVKDSSCQKWNTESSRTLRNSSNSLTDFKGVRQLLTMPEQIKSSQNDLSDLRGVKKLLRTPKVQKSPRNDLSDLRGVKKLLRTPKVQKSPKNDLSDLRGVKKLLGTPKVQKSPKNDLSDLRGVKKLLRTPKVQKSPKNDLSDLRGVKKLLRTPKVQKSPKNDLSDLRGVKKLLGTPKVQKSPKNDLSDLRGVKKLLRTPKIQKSPKNDLSDLRGVKTLLRTPKVQKSPKNDLSDLRGVKKLLGTPKVQKSPKNDLSDLRGVKKLLRTPKVQKSPRNNLSDVEGVQELFASPQRTKSSKGAARKRKMSRGSKNDLLDVTGVRELFARHKPISNYNVSLTGVSELFDKNKVEKEKEKLELEGNKSIDVSEPKTGRGRRRKLDEEKEHKMGAAKARYRQGSVEVKTRITRSKKLVTDADVEEQINEQRTVGSRKTSRGGKTGVVKKITRTRVHLKEKAISPEVEATKTLRKRKQVEVIEVSSPKLKRRALASMQSDSKVEPEESKKLAVRSKTSKAEEKDKAKSSKKAPVKSKTPAKKTLKVQTKATKSNANSISKTQKVQNARSQIGLHESLKSENFVSPRKTRSVSAKNLRQKTRTAAPGKKK